MPSLAAIDWRLCPIHLIQDGARLALPAGLARFIARISSEIEETQAFRKQLAKLPSSLTVAWQWAKARLQESTLDGGLDFKPWRGGGHSTYSIRLSKQYRAHIENAKPSGRWLAVAIGSHKAMGHG